MQKNPETGKGKPLSRDDLLARCEHIAQQQDILAELEHQLNGCTLVGDMRGARLLYLATLTRFFAKPVSIVIKGPPAAGKSHLLKSILELIPMSAYVEFSGISEKALAHYDGDVRHKYIVIQEFSGLQSDSGNPWLRMLLSEGKLTYASAVLVEGKGWKTQSKTLEGPTGLLMTTTEGALHPEDESRMLSITVEDTTEQTARVILAQAMQAGGSSAANPNDTHAWHSLQDWIAAGPHDVVIPFAADLAPLISSQANRIKRDFPQVLSLIKAHALLQQLNRSTDDQGRVVAELADYEAVYALVHDAVSSASEATVPTQVREVVQAATSVVNTRPDYKWGATQLVLAEKLGLDKSAVHHRVKSALIKGYLINQESRRGRPHQLLPGEPMPGDMDVLPSPIALAAAIANKKAG